MKKIVLVAHDPGGLDVIFPTYVQLKLAGEEPLLSCLGPAGEIKPDFQWKEEEFFSRLKSLVNKNKVKALVTGTSWGTRLEVEAIKYCKEKGIKTIAILDYWIGYASRFRLDTGEFVFPDYYIVMDELSKNEAINEGVPKEILVVLGHPGLDMVIKKAQQIKEPVVSTFDYLFLSQPISQVYDNELGYTEYTVLRDLENMNLDYRVKFHPKDDHVIRDLYRSRTVTGNLSQLIQESKMVIGMSTMGMLHSCILKKPTISYQPDLQLKDHAITNKLGLTPLFTDYEEVEVFFKTFKQNPMIYELPEETLQSFLWSDGASTLRIAHYIQEVTK